MSAASTMYSFRLEMVEHAVHVLRADIVGPGYGHIHPIDHILPVLIVKMAVLHFLRLSFFCIVLSLSVYKKQALLQRPCLPILVSGCGFFLRQLGSVVYTNVSVLGILFPQKAIEICYQPPIPTFFRIRISRSA